MFRRLGFGSATAAIVLTACAGFAAQSADDAEKKAKPAGDPAKAAEETPKPADEAPKAADATPQSPEELLTARGLTRSGASFILEKQEQECFKEFGGIRPLYAKLEDRYKKVTAIAMTEAGIADLQDQQAMTQQEIQNLSASGNSMSQYSSKYGGKYARYAQNPTAQMQQQLQAQQAALAQELAAAKQQAPTAAQKQEAIGMAERQRDELLASSSKVQDLFTAVQKQYTELDADPAVHTALTSVRKSAKAPLKIAPSSEFTKKFAQLKKLAMMLQPDSVPQAAPAKTKAKSKRTTKSKR